MKNTVSDIPKVFLDTNILIDYLIERNEDVRSSEMLFEAVMEGRIILVIAAHSLTDLFYITRKVFSPEQRRQAVLNFCAICSVAPVSGETIEKAIAAGYTPDLEDSLQIQCAVDSNSVLLVTRDKTGFINSPVKAVSPAEAVQALSL